MGINTPSDIEANLQIGPTSEGMVRIFDLLRSSLNDVQPKLQLYYSLDLSYDVNELALGVSFPIARMDIDGMRADPEVEAAMNLFLGAHVNMATVERNVATEIQTLLDLIAAELDPA